LGPLVDILDQHRDRRAGRHQRVAVLQDTGQDLHLVGLTTLGDEAGLARTPLVELALDIVTRETDAWRAAVDHAAERWPMALAPGRDPKEVPEGVVRHGVAPAGPAPATAAFYWPFLRWSNDRHKPRITAGCNSGRARTGTEWIRVAT